MDLPGDTAIIDVEDDRQKDEERNARSLRNITPPRIPDLRQGIAMCDFGIKINRIEYKHVPNDM